MVGPAAKVPERSVASLSERVRHAVPAIVVVLAVGLAIRLLLAFVVFPEAGLWSDLRLFGSWSLTLADHGPGAFYATPGLADYPPGYLWVLWAYGTAAKVVADVTGGAAPQIIPVWIKLPGIIADLLVAIVFYRALRRWQGERAGVIAAAAYLLCPVTWYDSALWGQVDSFGLLALSLAIIWLIDRRPELAAAAAMTAILIKPQFGLALGVVGIVLLRRYLHWPRRPTEGVVQTGSAFRRWWSRRDRDGPIRLLTSGLAAAAVLLVICLPFDLQVLADPGIAGIPVVGQLAGLVSLMTTTAGSYPYLTVNAFNPWALVGPTPLTDAIGGDYVWTYDSVSILGVPAAVIGTGLFLAVTAFVVALLWRRDDRESILVATLTLAVAFFVLPTRVHERYLFAAIGLGAMLFPMARHWRVWFVTATAVGLVNLHAILTLPYRGYGTPELRALPFADLARTPLVVTLTALASVAVLAWPLWRCWRLLRPRVVASVVSGVESPAGPITVGDTGGIAGPPARPLFRGRPDRRDAVAVGLIVLIGLALRLPGLDRPMGFYFDEDLHARTATEFLQGWRYGMLHDTSEWTHPQLAKYLIAAGIETMGGNQVAQVDSVPASVRDVAVEPGWTAADGSQRPSRLYLATDGDVVVRTMSGPGAPADRHVPIADPRHVAVDDAGHTLWVGTGNGALWTVEYRDGRGRRCQFSCTRPRRIVRCAHRPSLGGRRRPPPGVLGRVAAATGGRSRQRCSAAGGCFRRGRNAVRERRPPGRDRAERFAHPGPARPRGTRIPPDGAASPWG